MDHTDAPGPTDDEFQERRRVLALVAQTMAHAANEVLLLAHLEGTFDPKPASITGTEAARKALQHQVGRLVELLGGPPRILLTAPGRPPDTYDAYPAAAIDEAVMMFERARSAVCRSHLHFIAGSMIEKEPELVMGWPSDGDISAAMRRLAIDGFWEYAEGSYVKLASLWDRLGQLLDFAFFNIRQYERDGFAAVMDRIAANFVPLSAQLGESAHWKAIRAYQRSEQADGLKWLLRRRNLIIHSLHLRPVPVADGEDPLFLAAYNHLEQSMRSRLATGSRDEELRQLHRHLDQAANLFRDVLSLCEFAGRRA